MILKGILKEKLLQLSILPVICCSARCARKLEPFSKVISLTEIKLTVKSRGKNDNTLVKRPVCSFRIGKH